MLALVDASEDAFLRALVGEGDTSHVSTGEESEVRRVQAQEKDGSQGRLGARLWETDEVECQKGAPNLQRAGKGQ